MGLATASRTTRLSACVCVCMNHPYKCLVPCLPLVKFIVSVGGGVVTGLLPLLTPGKNFRRCVCLTPSLPPLVPALFLINYSCH